MDFGTAIRTCFQKYAIFNGRARRSEYWYFVLFGFLVNLGTSVVETVIKARSGTQSMLSIIATPALIGIGYAIFLFVLTVLPGTAGTNRYGPDPMATVADVF